MPRRHVLAALLRSERVLLKVDGAARTLADVQTLLLRAQALPVVAEPAREVLTPPPPAYGLRELPAPVRKVVQPLRRFVPPAVRARDIQPRTERSPRSRTVSRKHLTLVAELPAQFVSPVLNTKRPLPVDPIDDKRRESEGARALLLEIVRRAAYDWVLYRASTRIDQKQLAEEAYTWLFEEDEKHPWWAVRVEEGKILTAFISICDALDLDIEKVRRYVRALTPNRVMSSGRPPENSRASDHQPAIEVHANVGNGTSVDFEAFLSQSVDFD